eukprot:CAMPEP_0117440596 /NCGR_PEP_ID=MMETSP0759-20121206/3179_1 /TAXON_ID=63605 /ORGANISM="Percolomonas cosmopolitus, Strain WS" /LENGTH=317 /DNA_ID=CAMNT_0005232381 /DNA_START=248 /DNA_END=1201 /DNA_ORIENTATION=+
MTEKERDSARLPDEMTQNTRKTVGETLEENSEPPNTEDGKSNPLSNDTTPKATTTTTSPTTTTTTDVSSYVDGSRQLKEELEEQASCEALESGIGGNFFIRIRDNIDPGFVIAKMMKNFEENGVQSRFISKVVPVCRLCHVKENVIRENIKLVCDRAFAGLTSFQFKKWKIDFQKKYNSSVKKEEVHLWAQDYVKRWHIVERKNPEIVIFIWDKVCAIGAITNFDELHQLNLNRAKKELSGVGEKEDVRMTVSVFGAKPEEATKPASGETMEGSDTAQLTSLDPAKKPDAPADANQEEAKPKRKKKAKKDIGGIRLF